MYSDPQTITISAVAVPLPRTSSGVNAGTFTAPDGSVRLDVSHTFGKRVRRVAKISSTKIVPDPLVTSVNQQARASVYIVVDAPVQGFTPAEQKSMIDALAAWLAVGTGAANNALRLVGGES